MQKAIKKIRDTFEENIKSVYDLMNFDDIIQTICLKAIKRADNGLKKFGITSPIFSVEKEINVISNIRSHKSLRHHYQIMLNQCVVLLVSYFASAVQDLFSAAVSLKLTESPPDKLTKEDIRLTIAELQAFKSNSSDLIGSLLATKKDISFQDMQSIAKAFSDYLGFEPEKDKDVNNIILAQACRHTLVHSGGIVEAKTISQVSKATPRDIKKRLSSHERILFTTDEIKIIGTSMTNYIDKLIQGVI